MVDRLVIPQTIWQVMRDDVARCAPEEACGLLLGKQAYASECISITNTLHSPVRFRMDPVEQLRAFQRMDAAGLDLIAIYHSHPMGPKGPSATDLAEFSYPGSAYLIWARQGENWSVKAFLLDDGVPQEISIEII